ALPQIPKSSFRVEVLHRLILGFCATSEVSLPHLVLLTPRDLIELAVFLSSALNRRHAASKTSGGGGGHVSDHDDPLANPSA
ncbi:unnamed protein product, partial [Amoebophrya sp. A25]